MTRNYSSLSTYKKAAISLTAFLRQHLKMAHRLRLLIA
ncbi:hypothetical protein J699_01069 [Acinetobacter sp. 1000160]|nr:hypothetical protein J522_0295 [Acinetobacter baumannii 146457]EYT22884.1 hypothetical protein J699_01069 [Acinetobacter sp. 1000160]